MQQKVLQHFFDFCARMASRYPRRVLLVALGLMAAALTVTIAGLRFEPNRNDLISPDLEWNQRFLAWQESFPGVTDLYVIFDPGGRRDVDADSPLTQREKDARQLADELGNALRKLDTVEDVVWAYDDAQVHPRAARLLPLEEFTGQLDDARAAKALLESRSPAHLLQSALSMMNTAGGVQGIDAATADDDVSRDIRDFARLVDAFTERMNAPADQPVDLFRALNPTRRNYVTTENGKLLIMRITPRRADDPLNPLGPAIGQIREIIEQKRSEYPAVEFGLTGIEV
ncbi:MAG: hypothetical protein MJA84_00375, partial [Firmicutes bacterium]|nr:hypothetical protein [Bacillota bacterium]